MQQHVEVCPRCSRQDVAVRRSLMLVHSLPLVQPSPDFMARLNVRIDQLGPVSRADVVARRSLLVSVGAFSALAAGIAVVAYMAIETTHYYAPQQDLPVTPMVASAPEMPVAVPMANAAFVASVSTGMPVWPAVLMVGQAPMHFANMDFRETERTTR